MSSTPLLSSLCSPYDEHNTTITTRMNIRGRVVPIPLLNDGVSDTIAADDHQVQRTPNLALPLQAPPTVCYTPICDDTMPLGDQLVDGGFPLSLMSYIHSSPLHTEQSAIIPVQHDQSVVASLVTVKYGAPSRLPPPPTTIHPHHHSSSPLSDDSEGMHPSFHTDHCGGEEREKHTRFTDLWKSIRTSRESNNENCTAVTERSVDRQTRTRPVYIVTSQHVAPTSSKSATSTSASNRHDESPLQPPHHSDRPYSKFITTQIIITIWIMSS